MNRWIVLLRGINVSGQKKIIMSELREQMEIAGFKNVLTYIQSGNLVFDAILDLSRGDIISIVQNKILANFGYEVGVFALSPNQLSGIIAKNPFLKVPDVDNKQLYVTFLEAKPGEDQIDHLNKFNTDPDKYIFDGAIIYLRYLNGAGKSKLSNKLIESKLKLKATSRNWNTTNKLLDLSIGV